MKKFKVVRKDVTGQQSDKEFFFDTEVLARDYIAREILDDLKNELAFAYDLYVSKDWELIPLNFAVTVERKYV